MPEENLLQALHCSELDQAEFEQVIGSYFGHGHHANDHEICHARTSGGSALRVLYGKTGKFTKVLVGPDIQPGQIDELRTKIETELLTDGPSKVRRRVLFTAVPTVGYFRYHDIFQIFPLPAEAPRPKYIIGHHPLFLEFKVSTSSNFMITNLRVEKAGRELELLLSSLLDLRVWNIGPETRHHWSLDLAGDSVALPSKFLQEGYAWEGAVVELDDFSSPDGLPTLTQVDPNQYYSMRGLFVDRKLDIPSDITQQVDRFFALSVDDREKFLRASYWFQHANTVFSHSKSASFVALVSAIEALMPPPRGGKRCLHCNQMLGVGPTKQFVDFVEALIPGGAVPEPERKRFYQLRSALSHGGKLLANDHGVWGFTPKRLGEGQDARVVWQIVQFVLHNWLATK
jgi:hypothetical protein